MSTFDDLFDEMDRVFKGTPAILRDVEAMLDKEGFVSATNDSGVLAEKSNSVESPTWWYPGWVARAFIPKGQSLPECPLLVVSVLVRNRPGDDMKHLSVPLVTAGIWRFPDSKASDTWFKWVGKAWSWKDPAELSGVFRTITLSDPGAKGEVAAWDLMHVRTSAIVESQIVGGLIEQYRDGSGDS